MTVKHLWQGDWIDDAEAERRLAELDATAVEALAGPPSTAAVLDACDALARDLAGPDSAVRAELAAELAAAGVPEAEAEAVLDDLAELLRRDSLERLLTVQLGGPDPARPVPAGTGSAEYWAPVGLVTHLLPGNVATAGPWSVVEGLLTGNLNLAKTTGEGRFTQLALAALAAHDPTGTVAARTVVLAFPSRNQKWLHAICQAADAVVVWGGEEAVAGAAEHVRPGTRLTAWGHKISFSYLTEATWADREVLADIARSVCRHDQQACTSPQTVFVDTAEEQDLLAVADRLAEQLTEIGAGYPARTPSLQERAEITTTLTVARLEHHLGLGRVLVDPDGHWRILVGTSPELAASPLFRTVMLRPLPRADIAAVLHPYRRYLQTVGLAAAPEEAAGLAETFVRAGALRITAPGAVNSGYPGEPHDGVLALPQHARRVSVPA